MDFAGTVMTRLIDSFMYRVQNGVASVLLDDDNCACWSVLSMGHGMCFSSSSGSTYGVDSLYDPSCTKPSPTRGLTLYFRGIYDFNINPLRKEECRYLQSESS